MLDEIAMELHRGRLIDHVHLRARDLKASQRFYAAILGVLGIPVVSDDKHLAADELWIDAGEQSSHVHLAFQTSDREMVDKAWRAGEDLDLRQLIHDINRPPIENVGAVDLESFFPARERSKLAATKRT